MAFGIFGKGLKKESKITPSPTNPVNINPDPSTPPIYYVTRWDLYGNQANGLLEDDVLYPFGNSDVEGFLIKNVINCLSPGKTLKTTGYGKIHGYTYSSPDHIPKIPYYDQKQLIDPAGVKGKVSYKVEYSVSNPKKLDWQDQSQQLKNLNQSGQSDQSAQQQGNSLNGIYGSAQAQSAANNGWPNNGSLYGAGISAGGIGSIGSIGSIGGIGGIGIPLVEKDFSPLSQYSPGTTVKYQLTPTPEQIKAAKAGKYDYMLDKEDQVPVELPVIEEPTGRKFRDED